MDPFNAVFPGNENYSNEMVEIKNIQFVRKHKSRSLI